LWKLGIPFWLFLTDRLGIEGQTIEPLQNIIMQRATLATVY
jgi:hypothetical protein